MRIATGSLALAASLLTAAGAHATKEKTAPVRIESYRSYVGQSYQSISPRKGVYEPAFIHLHTDGQKRIDAADLIYACPNKKFTRRTVLTHDRVPDYVPVAFKGRKFEVTWTSGWSSMDGSGKTGTNTVTIRGTVRKRRRAPSGGFYWFASATAQVKAEDCTPKPFRFEVQRGKKSVRADLD